MANGLYRLTEDCGAEWVMTDEPAIDGVDLIYTKDTYIALGCLPPYDELPTRAEYEAANPVPPVPGPLGQDRI